MNSISLYGHLTTDTIFNGDVTYNSVGGIGNVWLMLSKICKNYQVNVEPTNIGEALILVNKDKAERSSIANLNKIQRTPIIKDSNWSHILYVNELQDISFIKDVRNRSKVVSIDICKGKPFKQFDMLKYIDYFFISDEDLFMDIKKLTSKFKGWVILHHKGGSKCFTRDQSFEISTPVIDNINVLGAGDMFAAAVMKCILNTTVDKLKLQNNIKEAHLLTSKILAEINEKN
tara:strand:+ start:10102 stop:10794 length:693 start_codon:yes stop_codon:yes gene_type:complete